MSSHALSLGNTQGAAFVGVVVASSLHGVSCLQAWYYFTHQNDKWPLKASVSAVVLFDTVHQILITHSVYTYLVSYFGDPALLENLVWSLILEVLFNGLIALIVQSFLALRLWRLSNHNVLVTTVAAILVISEFTCIIVFTSIGFRFRTFEQLATLKYLSIVVNALAAAGDVLIAASLCWLLHRSRTGFQKSDTIINKLILFAVNTGCLTSLCAVASLISILVAGETFVYIAFFFCIGRLYSNSLLATLNARKMIRDSADGIQSTEENFDYSFNMRNMSKMATVGSKHRGNISIKIDTTKELATDHDSDRDHSGGDIRRNSMDLTMNEKECTPSTVNTARYLYKEQQDAV